MGIGVRNGSRCLMVFRAFTRTEKARMRRPRNAGTPIANVAATGIEPVWWVYETHEIPDLYAAPNMKANCLLPQRTRPAGSLTRSAYQRMSHPHLW